MNPYAVIMCLRPYIPWINGSMAEWWEWTEDRPDDEPRFWPPIALDAQMQRIRK